MWCFDPTWNDPKFGISKSVQFRHICVAFRFWSNFGWPKIWVIPCWVTTPCGCHWLHLTNSGRQFQQWSLFTFKQYCLKGILAKESSPRTKDFLLWRDLLCGNFLSAYWDPCEPKTTWNSHSAPEKEDNNPAGDHRVLLAANEVCHASALSYLLMVKRVRLPGHSNKWR